MVNVLRLLILDIWQSQKFPSHPLFPFGLPTDF
jgi:hypothetical protein